MCMLVHLKILVFIKLLAATKLNYPENESIKKAT